MEKQITASEWTLMECLWEQAPKSLMQLVRELEPRTGWAKSTVATMLSRMERKGLIRYDTDGKTKQFYPAVRREDVAAQETQGLLERVYHGSVGMLLSAVTQRTDLTRQDLDELYEILRKAEEDLP